MLECFPLQKLKVMVEVAKALFIFLNLKQRCILEDDCCINETLNKYCLCLMHVYIYSHVHCYVLGTTWMNWCLFGSVCGAVPLLLLAKERYGRSDIDAKEIIVHEPPENPSMQRDHAHQIHDSDTTTAVEV